jgi:O-antigen/teichoic acid export membrane protein
MIKLASKMKLIKEAIDNIAGKSSRSFGYSFLQQLTNLLAGFIGFLILVRVIPKDDFGMWVLFLSITVLFDMARNGLIQNAFIKFFVVSDDDTKPRIITASTLLNFIITCVSIILLNLAAPLLAAIWNSTILIYLIRWYTITAFFSVFYSQFNFLLQAKSNFKGVFLINFARQAFFLLGIIVLSISNELDSLVSLVLLQSAGIMLGGLLGYMIIKDEIKLKFNIDKSWIIKLFNYGKFVLGTSASSIFLNNIDNMMLGFMIGPASVAVYNIAFRITNLVEVPIATISLVVFPQSAQRMKSEGLQSVKYLYEKSVGAILAMILPVSIMVFIFAENIVVFVAGDQYIASADILRIIVLFTLLKPFLRQFGTTLDAIGKPQINFYTILILSLTNLISNYIFINLMGVIGAAVGTLLTLLISLLINSVILKKELQIKIINPIIYLYQIYNDTFKMLFNSVRCNTKLSES